MTPHEYFLKCWKWLHGIEGEWSNHPSDPGGATRFGITEEVARKWGYFGPMKDLPYVTAMQIGKEGYWDVLNLDALSKITPLVAREIFEIGFNIGVGKGLPGRFLQMSLNSLNRRQKDFGDINVDGIIGIQTLGAIRSYFSVRRNARSILLKAINIHQGYYYLALARDNSKFEDFSNGWLDHRIQINFEGDSNEWV